MTHDFDSTLSELEKSLKLTFEPERFGIEIYLSGNEIAAIQFALRLAKVVHEEPTASMRVEGVKSDDWQTGNERCAHIYKAMTQQLIKDIEYETKK